MMRAKGLFVEKWTLRNRCPFSAALCAHERVNGFSLAGEEEHIATTIGFPNEILKWLRCVAGKVTNDGELDVVVDAFLQNLSGQAAG